MLNDAFHNSRQFQIFLISSYLILLHQGPEVEHIRATFPGDLDTGLGVLPGGGIAAVQFVTYQSETKKTSSNCHWCSVVSVFCGTHHVYQFVKPADITPHKLNPKHSNISGLKLQLVWSFSGHPLVLSHLKMSLFDKYTSGWERSNSNKHTA